MIRALLLVAISTLVSSQVLLRINNIQTVQIFNTSIIYTSDAIIQATASSAVCDSSIVFTYLLQHQGTITLVATEGASVVLIDTLAYISTNIVVMWCAEFNPATTTYAAPSFSSANPSTTLGSVTQGMCQLDMTRTGPTATGFIAIALGLSHAAAIHTSGTIYSWGSNDHCQLGTLLSSPDPVTDLTPFPWFTDFIAPIISLQHITCARRRTSMDLFCWGSPIAPPTGTDCKYYTSASFAIANVLLFGVTQNIIVALLNNGSIAMTGISEHFITSIVDTYKLTPSFQIQGADWSNYPTISSSSPIGAITGITGGVDDTFLLYDSTQHSLFILGIDEPACTTLHGVYSTTASIFQSLCRINTIVNNFGTFILTNNYLFMANTSAVTQTSRITGNSIQVSSVVSTSLSTFSIGIDSVCITIVSNSMCLSNNISGDAIYSSTSALAPWRFVTNYVTAGSIVVAGGNARCELNTISGNIWCTGTYGNGVLQVFGYGQPILIIGPDSYNDQFILAGSTTQSITTDHYTTITGMPGCFQPLQISLNSTTVATVYATTQKRRYQINSTICLEILSCVDPDWKVDYGPFPSCITNVVAGAFHTCILTCDGQVMCTGLNLQCQYLPYSYSDSRLFNPIYTGSFIGASAVYAHANITCVVSLQTSYIFCTGSFGPDYSLCNKDISTTHSVNGAIISVSIGSTAVCIAIKNADTVTYECIGVNTNGKLGYSPLTFGMAWASCKGSTGTLLSTLATNNNPQIAIFDSATIIFFPPSISAYTTIGNPYFSAFNFMNGNLNVLAVSGNNTFSLLSDGYFHSQTTTFIPPVGTFLSISSNSDTYACVLLSINAFVCINTSVPIIPVIGTSISKIAVGTSHIAVLDRQTNKLCISGSNLYGQCGRLYTNYSTPQFVCVSAETPYWPYSLVSAMTPIVLQEVPTGSIDPTYMVAFTGTLIVIFVIIIAFISVFAISATSRLRHLDHLFKLNIAA